MMLDIQHLFFEYPDQPILHDVHISIHPGTLMHIPGHNGAGNTTLLKLLTGLLTPTCGQIVYNNHNIVDDLSHYQQHLCYVGHKPGIHPHLTVEEHCTFEAQQIPESPPVDTILHTAHLYTLRHTRNRDLSFGQRRRVALARLLMRRARIWLLDEPWIGLDPQSIAQLMQWMHQHLNQDGLIVLSSHQALPPSLIHYRTYHL